MLLPKKETSYLLTTTYPLIILFCLIGVYSVRNTASDVVIMFIFGILG